MQQIRSVMSEKFNELSNDLRQWISTQPMFFVATADAKGHINLSPKGQQSLEVTGSRELTWLNLTGSGNETAAHLNQVNRMTLMWCAFNGPPRILRVYGQAKTIHPRDAAWAECNELIPAPLGARQYYRVKIDLVQTSCGYAVPLMDYQADRQVLDLWAEKRGAQGIQDYWQEKNQISLDGLDTGIID